MLYRLNRRHDNAAVISYAEDLRWLRSQIVSDLPGYGDLTYAHAVDFVERHPAWPLGKKTAFLKMAKRVCAIPLSTLPQYVVEGVHHDVFLKDEPYPRGKAPRVIANAQPAAKVILALLLDHINEWFFRQKWTVKHYDVPGRVKALGRFNSDVVNVDHTSFECSVDSQRYALELNVYEDLFGPNPLLHSLFMERIRHGVHLESRSGLHAALSVVRASGDFDTSLGNSLINLVVMHHAIVATGNSLVDCLVEGDDGVFQLRNHPDLTRMTTDLKAQGFEPKLEFGPPKFCGLSLDDYGYTMDINKVCHKLLMHTPTSLHHVEYQKAAVEAANLQCPNHPVLKSLARDLGCVNGDYNESMVDYLAHHSRTGINMVQAKYIASVPVPYRLSAYLRALQPQDAYEYHSHNYNHAAFYQKTNHQPERQKEKRKSRQAIYIPATEEVNYYNSSTTGQVRVCTSP